MGRLTNWEQLAAGGVVVPDEAARPRTGSWRTGVKPEADLSKCVNCLLCWLYCPDSAISLDDAVFTGFDLRYCKGCELCSVVCPTGAVTMVEERNGG